MELSLHNKGHRTVIPSHHKGYKVTGIHSLIAFALIEPKPYSGLSDIYLLR